MLQQKQWFDYDEVGRVRAERGNNGQNVRYTYDVNGNVKTVLNSSSKTTTLNYDPLNRLSSSVNPLNGAVSYTYDMLDNAVTIQDPRGLTTSRLFDGLGLQWSTTSPDRGTTSYAYNPSGQLQTITRPDGTSVGYQYDALSRITWTGNSNWARIYSYDWCSNGKGRLCGTQVNDAQTLHTWTHYGYTPRGQMSVRRDSISGSDDWTGFNYDSFGRLTSLAYANGAKAVYGYSGARLRNLDVTIGGSTISVVSNANYAGSGVSTDWLYGNGLGRVYSHDQDGRAIGISAASGANIIQSLTVGFNADGVISALTNAANSAQSHAFGYDALSRLSSDSVGGGAIQITDNFDANDNLVSRTRLPSGGTSESTTFSIATASNRLTAISGALTRSLTYGAHGNLVSSTGEGGSRTLTYDPYLRLRTLTKDGVTTSYTFNAEDERVGKASSTSSSRYIYGGRSQLLSENKDGAWSNYLWFGGELVGVVRNGAVYYVHSDQLGRPEIVTDSAKQPVWKAANAPYSREVLLDTFGGLNFGLPGQYFDIESGYWQNGFRHYDGTTGRYIEADPSGLAGGLNPYVYVNANPINDIDPYGLEKLILFRPETIFYVGASAEPDSSGVWRIYGHMGPTEVLDQRTGKTARLDVDGVARMLKAAGWKEGQPVVFEGCRAGQGEDSIAEKFAQKYKTPTQGPSSYVWYSRQGITGIGGKWPIFGGRNPFADGEMRSFSPGK